MDETAQPYASTVVRLSFLPDHRDKIDTSEEWYKVLDTIKHQPNFGYICKGESIDDELDVVLIIAWENAAKPPAAFLSEDLDCIFSPINAFVANKPRVMGTLYRMMRGPRSTGSFTTSGAGMDYMSEIMTIRGPAVVIEPALEEIERHIRSYVETRNLAIDLHDFFDWLLIHGCLFRLDDDLEGHPDTASFVLYLQWRGREQRNEFHDVGVPDRTLPPHLQEFFPSNFWQVTVIERLERLGATTSSWTYHKGKIARDEENREVIASEFAHWYHFGY